MERALEELEFMPEEGEGWSRIIFPDKEEYNTATPSSSSSNILIRTKDLISVDGSDAYRKIQGVRPREVLLQRFNAQGPDASRQALWNASRALTRRATTSSAPTAGSA